MTTFFVGCVYARCFIFCGCGFGCMVITSLRISHTHSIVHFCHFFVCFVWLVHANTLFCMIFVPLLYMVYFSVDVCVVYRRVIKVHEAFVAFRF